jgi:acetyltransferase-like isoleucine patch superfamily enzyme
MKSNLVGRECWDSSQSMNPFNSGYYNEHDLKDAGFKTIGHNVRIAKNCTIIGLENIEIGNNVRVDGYCSILAAGQGWLKLGSHVSVSSYCFLSAGAGIEIGDFSVLSQGVCIYSRSDDYTGKYLTGHTVPEKYKGVFHGTVTVGRHALIGSGSVILPKLSIGEGSSVGALSLVKKSLGPWGVYFGCPAKRLQNRSKRILQLETELNQEHGPNFGTQDL